jgi:hypothetical protein
MASFIVIAQNLPGDISNYYYEASIWVEIRTEYVQNICLDHYYFTILSVATAENLQPVCYSFEQFEAKEN